MLSERLTGIPGASKVFMGGIVAYSPGVTRGSMGEAAVYTPGAKISILGVEPDLINDKGAVSREVALAMADGARKMFGSDIGIGITGIAGPDSDGSGLKPGTVYIALTTENRAFCRNPALYRERDRNRVGASSHALDMVRRLLTGLVVE